MDQTILALLGVIITLMLYLDRGRRADLAQLRRETHNGFSQLRHEIQEGNRQLREEMQNGDTQIREEMQEGDRQLREEMQRGFARLADIIMDLVRRVGRLEGRAEAEATPAQPAP